LAERPGNAGRLVRRPGDLAPPTRTAMPSPGGRGPRPAVPAAPASRRR
jgi:hypothetical protein